VSVGALLATPGIGPARTKHRAQTQLPDLGSFSGAASSAPTHKEDHAEGRDALLEALARLLAP
jgi:hypothetical protein